MTTKPPLTDSHFSQLMAEKTPLVKQMARNLWRRLPASVECDDLI